MSVPQHLRDSDPDSVSGSPTLVRAASTPVSISVRPFVAALGVAVLINSLIRAWVVMGRAGSFHGSSDTIRSLLGGSVVLQGVVTLAFLLALLAALPALWANRLPSRGLLHLLGVLASLTLAICLSVVLITMARRNLVSYELLLEAGALYIAINLVFAYWYWFADHPLRFGVRLADQSIDYNQGIRFPEEAQHPTLGGAVNWSPNLTDYVYFTLVSSNSLGAPEGHVLIGNRLKQIQLIHSASMLFVFIIIVARAINTLE